MPPEIVALIDNPLLLAAILAVGAMCGVAAERLFEHFDKERRRAYWRGRNHGGTAHVQLGGAIPASRSRPQKVRWTSCTG